MLSSFTPCSSSSAYEPLVPTPIQQHACCNPPSNIFAKESKQTWRPSPGYSIIVKVQAPSTFTATSDLTAVVAEAGAAITALDIVDASHESNIINLACNTLGKEHSRKVKDSIDAVEGFEVLSLSDRTFHMHQGGNLRRPPRSTFETATIYHAPTHRV